MWSVLSEWWPLAALLVPSAAVSDSLLLLLASSAAVLLFAVLMITSRRPLLSTRVHEATGEAFAVVRVRLRASDPQAEGHVRSRAPGAVS